MDKGWDIDELSRESDYVPPKRPYSFLAMLDDILYFAAGNLVPGGRLCFWMPTANEDFSELDIPMHPQLKLVSVCVQEFNKCISSLHKNRIYANSGDRVEEIIDLLTNRGG
jgi:tRNA G10  N-methylase Trm11